jgi:hypothetical protein
VSPLPYKANQEYEGMTDTVITKAIGKEREYLRATIAPSMSATPTGCLLPGISYLLSSRIIIH